MPRFAISSGHGLHIRGARGNPVPPQIDEVDQARRVVDRVVELWQAAGIQCAKFHDNTSTTQSQNLNTITSWHNKQTRDYDISVHFNAYNQASANGTEVLYVTQKALASKVAKAIVGAGGFTLRSPNTGGAVYRGDLAFLNNTNKPAVLLETCFCTNSSDSSKYTSQFEAICKAIAESLSGQPITGEPIEPPTEPPVQPPEPGDPLEVPVESRPTVKKGSKGPDVGDLQYLLNGTDLAPGLVVDGDFGNLTDGAVRNYQASRGLMIDGVCGQQTWGALYNDTPAKPQPQIPPAFTTAEQDHISRLALDSRIANYNWRDRGRAPNGYLQGMALAFGQTYRKLLLQHPAAVKMSRARTSSDKDALNIYRGQFDALQMSNETAGPETLRHLYAFMLGSGMRESSGKHCEGRDMSASNTTSDTAEAGLFQTSYNARSASNPEFDNLMAEYSAAQNKPSCYIERFAQGVSCSSSSWSNYGSGAGAQFQALCKNCPSFACETHGLTLRSLANHYGPVIRKEVELKSDADVMFKTVQDYVDERYPVA